jgi:hypothetical protein
MSEAAHVAYGLSPLVEGKLEGDVRHEAVEGIPEVNIYIVSPEELGVDKEDLAGGGQELDEPDAMQIGVKHKTYLSPDRIGLVVCLTDDRKGFEAQIINKITRHLGIEGEEIDERVIAVTDLGEEPASEAFTRDVPQMMVHALAGSIKESMLEPTIEWQRIKMNQHMYKLTKLAGLAAVVGTGLYTAADLVLGGGTANLLTGDALFAGIPLGTAWRGFKYYLDSNNLREQKIHETAAKFSHIVGQGFHEAYCLAHFDERTEGWIEEPNN